MSENAEGATPQPPDERANSRGRRSVEWYAPGQERLVVVGGVSVAVRLVERRGRRARIVITAPPRVVFSAAEPDAELKP